MLLEEQGLKTVIADIDVKKREEQKKVLEAWKAEKAKKKQEEEWQLEYKRGLKAKKQEKEKERRLEIKKTVRLYVEQKEKDEDIKKRWQEEIECALDVRVIQDEHKDMEERFLKRNSEAIKKRAELIQQKKLQAEERKRRQDKMSIQVII